ncbi:hypothetical protein COOONC_15943 [Cooperia oncophora]
MCFGETRSNPVISISIISSPIINMDLFLVALTQGGVLSPVLFNIFTAELPGILREAGVIAKVYADDLKIYKTISHNTDYLVLQKAIDVTVDWSKKWQLPVASQ